MSDTLKYFYGMKGPKAQVMCVSLDMYFILAQEISRYEQECEQCPCWSPFKLEQ